MKKAYFILALAATAILFTQSCKKCDMADNDPAPIVTNETVDASLNENTTYTYTLPVTANGAQAQITTAPAHATLSAVTIDPNGTPVYEYTPSANFVGTDVVVITTQAGPGSCQGGGHGACNGGGHGNCNGHGCGNCAQGSNPPPPNQVITTINFTINSTSSTATSRQTTSVSIIHN